MRGNWEAAEALVLAPGQQLQQQQQSIMEEQRLPLHSPTTPAWGGIADRRVKEEPVEDKNNDSGVSPGHYTSNSVSPRSRRSSSTANCSLSPGSATSQDSSAMQCVNFDSYSPQSIYKNCDSPIEYGRLRTIEDASQHRSSEHQPMDVVSSSMKSNVDESEIVQDALQCPVCPFATSNRLEFTEHLAAHYAANCETPDFTKSLLTSHDNENDQETEQTGHTMNAMEEADRASPSQGERSEQESEEADEPGLRVPRVNSHGKVKTFRCKQCNFVAITKLEFWEHSRGHIKAEKLLTCPKCPFVTEYKHHLEYHLRNHFGSKPFKCEKCSYSCVNKSMLNSHLKSHSNVYQYRCANCSYATKYCHSLKLHLRKYGHKPAMVLNADGSPNPLPIIDVYGTRRGPKQKSTIGNNGNLTGDNGGQTGNGGLPGQSGQLSVRPELSPISRNHSSPMNPMSAIQALGNGANQTVLTFPYGQIFAGFPMASRYPTSDETTEKHLEHLRTNLIAEYAKVMTNDGTSVDHHQELGMNNFLNSSVNIEGINEIAMSPTSSEGGNYSKIPIVMTDESRTNISNISISGVNKFTPLDLSKPDFLANNNNHSNTNNNITRDIFGQTNGTSSTTNSPKTSGTSRRKGRAVRLDRRVVEDETDEERERDSMNREASMTEDRKDETSRATIEDGKEETTRKMNSSRGNSNEANLSAENLNGGHFNGAGTNDATMNGVSTTKETSPERSFGGVGMSNEFTCQYCEIAFGNVVMYTVHMGYHGYKDPYTCNMCGHECDDKVSFFLHIARSKHS